MDFCNDENFRNTIATLLATTLFGCRRSVVLKWYQTFISNRLSMPHSTSYTICPSTSGLPNLSTIASYPYIGHDLPVWLSNGKSVFDPINSIDNPLTSNHRVMVIGQDPLRVEANAGYLSIMSPWGLHYPDAYPKHSKGYNNLFSPLLYLGCEIYVTDYWKLFVAESVDKNNTKLAINTSRSILTPTYGRIFNQILEEEIKAFHPSSILILSIDKTIYPPILSAIGHLIGSAYRVPMSGGVPVWIPTRTSGSINVLCAPHPNARGLTKNFYIKNVIPYL